MPPHPLVAGAEITLGIVGGQIVLGWTLHLSLPGSLGAMGRDEYPIAVEQIAAAVGMFGRVELGEQARR